MAFISKYAVGGVSAGIFLALSGLAIEPQPADARFSLQAAMNTWFEIQTGELAILRSPNDQVKQYGQRMVSDYTTLQDQLKSIGVKDAFRLPDGVGEKNRSTMDLLAQISGPLPLAEPAFDQVYISETIGAHKTDIAAFEEEMSSGVNPDLRNWAASALPILREHLQLGRDTQKYLGSVSQIFTKNKDSGQW